MTPRPPTDTQERAIAAEGNVLVMAGAGTGKTRTLVDRCLARVCDGPVPVSLDRILMVTFTEAAAAEMRLRVRQELERRAAADPADVRLAEQLALVDSARISTLHSFCLQLVRDHFHELELDPQSAVLDEGQAAMLAGETLERLLQDHYRGDAPADHAVQQLVLDQGGGWDEPVRELVLRLHHYTQTLADPEAWFARQLAWLRETRPDRWQQWLLDGFEEWRTGALALLDAQPPDNTFARHCADALRALPGRPDLRQAATALSLIVALGTEWPASAKGLNRDAVEKIFDDARFLATLTATDAGTDPLAQDWDWVRPQMITLLELARRFTAGFARAKRDVAALDFHDLEQFALRLLYDPASDGPTPAAAHWRRRLELVFVDEYQDINEAQDAILRALAREGPLANRFLVGDVKQSIYRFRLADPRIFQQYARDWGRPSPGPDPAGRVIPLADNFRSHPAILDFVNALFESLMRPEVGGVSYDQDQRLHPGTPGPDPSGPAAVDGAAGRPARTEPAAPGPDAPPPVELHLRLTGAGSDGPPEGDGQNQPQPRDGLADLTAAEQEARLIAVRLRQLRSEKSPVRDPLTGQWRAVDWGDMAVLLRSPGHKADRYARVFDAMGIPLAIARGGFFECLEITDLVSLLRVLDNPFQDEPLLAVLRSPLVAMSPDELAAIRIGRRRGSFWTALARFRAVSAAERPGPAEAAIHQAARLKAILFLDRFAEWRRLARESPLSQCLETVLDGTHYEAWLLTQPRGAQRRANVRRLLELTRQFDHFQRHGLFRFLNLVRAQEEAGIESEPARVTSENAVRLCSIHQSKGLEFPVVAVADLGKRFNLGAAGGILLDEVYGLCPRVKPPHTGQSYPSLPLWLAQRRQRRETLGEELRLFYVALTRARDRLILAGTVSTRAVTERWPIDSSTSPAAHQILAAGSCLDWLGRWLPAATGNRDWTTSGAGRLLTWTIHGEVGTSRPPSVADPSTLRSKATAEDGLRRTGCDVPARGSVEGGTSGSSRSRENAASAPSDETGPPAADPQAARAAEPAETGPLEPLLARLNWTYPPAAATLEPAKSSVSELRRRAQADIDEDARRLFQGPALRTPARPGSRVSTGPLSAAEIGSAHHAFLETVHLDRTGTRQDLQAEAERLRQEGALSDQETAALRLDRLLEFWQSELGRQICAQPRAAVHREMPFTARISAADLATVQIPFQAGLAVDEFVVIQGVVDLAVLLPDEIWLLDFKTDDVSPAELEEKVGFYKPQLRLYALALGRIYRRPVTGAWLHFLAPGRTVPVTEGASPSATAAPARPTSRSSETGPRQTEFPDSFLEGGGAGPS